MLKSSLYFMVAVSFFSVFLITSLAFFPPKIHDEFQWRKPLTGSIFALICILGMIAAFFPKKCSRIFHENRSRIINNDSFISKKGKFRKFTKIFGLTLTHGHHLECQGFSHHEFQMGEKTFCIACMGLFFGAVASIFGVIAYFFFNWFVGISGWFVVVFGTTCVVSCFLQYAFFDFHWKLIRFSFNAFFVFGMFLVLVGLDYIVQSLTLNFFLIGLFVFWLSTRILLSKNGHKKICRVCTQSCGIKNK